MADAAMQIKMLSYEESQSDSDFYVVFFMTFYLFMFSTATL